MYKKIFLIIACNLYQLNHCFFQNAVHAIYTVLEKRAEYASQLNNDLNRLCNFSLSSKIDNPISQEVIALSDFPGNVPKEAHQIVHALTNPRTFTCSPGYIFYGEPGTGKNTLAHAIAKEAKAYLIDQPASEFMNTYIGKGAAEIRKLFLRAKDLSRNAPVIIFIDEIDTIGSRGYNDNTEVTSTFNQLLNSMNHIESYHPIVVIAATNCENKIDTSLRRTGRFALVHIKIPNQEERLSILTYYARKYNCPFNEKFYQRIAQQTDNFCCASLEGIFRQASYIAGTKSIPIIGRNHILEAVEHEKALYLKNKHIQDENEQRSHDNIQAEHLNHSRHQLSLGLFNTVLAVTTFLTYLFV
jgi:ATP-dependent Zn protease